jgi:hypothetical protein
MITRVALALVMTLTSLMLAISPIAGMAGADGLACAQKIDMGNGHQHTGHEVMIQVQEDIGKPGFVCCDQGCLLDLTVTALTQQMAMSPSRVPSQWVASDLSDLTDPKGLRRPPRA